MGHLEDIFDCTKSSSFREERTEQKVSDMRSCIENHTPSGKHWTLMKGVEESWDTIFSMQFRKSFNELLGDFLFFVSNIDSYVFSFFIEAAQKMKKDSDLHEACKASTQPWPKHYHSIITDAWTEFPSNEAITLMESGGGSWEEQFILIEFNRFLEDNWKIPEKGEGPQNYLGNNRTYIRSEKIIKHCNAFRASVDEYFKEEADEKISSFLEILKKQVFNGLAYYDSKNDKELSESARKYSWIWIISHLSSLKTYRWDDILIYQQKNSRMDSLNLDLIIEFFQNKDNPHSVWRYYEKEQILNIQDIVSGLILNEILPQGNSLPIKKKRL